MSHVKETCRVGKRHVVRERDMSLSRISSRHKRRLRHFGSRSVARKVKKVGGAARLWCMAVVAELCCRDGVATSAERSCQEAN